MASESMHRLKTDYVLWVELFALANLAFLALDIYIAHSENGFLRGAEYAPLYFSLAAPVALAIALWARQSWARPRLWSGIGYAVAVVAIGLGLSGVIYHLDSQFFYERTIRSLTYAAPFAAPLAYTGVGMLLLLNRMEPTPADRWASWILFLTLGGYFGNFLLSLTDHAENGFFHWTEWIPVASSGLAVGFLTVLFLIPLTSRYLGACRIVLLIQGAVGIIGFGLHANADLHGVSRSFFENVVDGAPPFAPLLFPNLMVLGLIGLWFLPAHQTADGADPRAPTLPTPSSSPGAYGP